MLVLTALAWLPSGLDGRTVFTAQLVVGRRTPGNFVRSAVQAPDRFLWVATAEGVVLFDGVRFTLPGGTVISGDYPAAAKNPVSPA